MNRMESNTCASDTALKTGLSFISYPPIHIQESQCNEERMERATGNIVDPYVRRSASERFDSPFNS
jgi:hypothetical protein